MLNLIRKLIQRHTLLIHVVFSGFAFIIIVVICYLFMSANTRRHLLKNTENLIGYEQFRIESELLKSKITLTMFT